MPKKISEDKRFLSFGPVQNSPKVEEKKIVQKPELIKTEER